MIELIEGKACIADVLSTEMCNELIAAAEKHDQWRPCLFGGAKGGVFIRKDVPNVADIVSFGEAPFFRDILGAVTNRILGLASFLSGELITQIYDDSRFVRSPLGAIAPKHLDSTEKVFTYRKLTGLVYLNDHTYGLEGGGTNFEWLDTQYQPKQGRVIVFHSNQYHGAVPVIAGTKYLLDLFMGNQPRP